MTYSSLDLTFSQKNAKTQLSHSKHYGSLVVQRALHPEMSANSDTNDICHLMILNPSAGIALGDTMEIKAILETNLEANTHAVMTTTGAGKWYGQGRSHIGEIVIDESLDDKYVSENSNEATATKGIQNVHITLGDNCRAEWIPQENILFDDARIEATTEFYLAPTASLLTWDILVLGRQAYNETFKNGHYANQFVIKRVDKEGHKPIVFESVNQSADSRWFRSPLGVNGKHIIGTFWAIPDEANIVKLENTIDELRNHIQAQNLPVVCTTTNAGLCIRYLGDDVRACFSAFSELRHIIRKLWWGIEPYEPRIWHT